MHPKLKGEYLDSGFLIGAICIWGISAAALLLVASVILTETGCSESSLGYISSAISFLSALSAGVIAARKRKSGAVYTALMTSVVIITGLLTIGFLVDGADIEPSAVMSVISFTFTGTLAGTLCSPMHASKKKKFRPRP